jgi:hypothetical protein
MKRTGDSTAGASWRFCFLEGASMDQILIALYIALSEAAGGPAARAVANRVLLDAIKNHSIDDEGAIEFLRTLCTDDEAKGPSELVH